MKLTPNHLKRELTRLLTRIRDRRAMASFLEDLLTPQEFIEVATRWQLVKMLHRKVPQRTIAKKLNISIATITRGSRMLLNPRGGFQKLLKKRKK